MSTSFASSYKKAFVLALHKQYGFILPQLDKVWCESTSNGILCEYRGVGFRYLGYVDRRARNRFDVFLDTMTAKGKIEKINAYSAWRDVSSLYKKVIKRR